MSNRRKQPASQNKDIPAAPSVAAALGKTVYEKRDERRLSQEKLAELIDASTHTISDIECGKSNASLRMLEKLAAALDTTVSRLTEQQTEASFTADITELCRKYSIDPRALPEHMNDYLYDIGESGQQEVLLQWLRRQSFSSQD